jgi:acyl transferase domain-containing protein
MKTAWEALEIAGYPEEPAGTRIGVFAGCGNPNYLAAERHVPEAERLQRLIGNGADFLATRTAYALGLTGPAISVQTACSTSLVAVANAGNAIRNGQCEMAIAGGSSCSWPMGEGYQQGAGLIYSADGHCRTFDHRASGTIFSQASGAVLLRPLQDAIKAGDTIHAVIKGIAVNNDGDRKGGYAAPSIQGQCDVIQAALDDAEVSADQIELMEAHGTATKIGDPIEISGLKRAWQRDTQEKQFCAIGSVKANVGHADAAAGIVGLLKVILSLQHKTIPPLVNYESPNPEIVFEDTPFYVNTKAMPWQSEKPTRLAAISSFGMGGTNAHLIVAEGQSVAAVEGDNGDETLPLQLIPFSARTRESLDELVESWSRMQLTQEHALADIAFTLQAGRKHFGHRAVSIVKTPVQLKNSIAAVNPAEAVSEDSPALVFGRDRAVKRKVVFLFTGQGAQYSNMARDLYENEPVFRAAIDHCDAQLNDVADGLIQWLFSESPACDINQTRYAQVALFAVSYAQAKLWQSWGVSPAVMIGHSIGEYVAATIAGVFSLNDALAMVAKRGQLMQSMPAGSMLAVMHHEHDIQALLEQSDHLDLAVINSRSVAVVAGPNEAIDRFAQQLETQEIKSRQLKTSHAFHSRMMEPMLDSFIQAFSEVELSSPKIPYLSNVSGTWITKEQSIDPNYYADQIRSTVKFAENLESLMKSEEE